MQLPFTKMGENFWLKYSLVRDGASTHTFLQHMRSSKYVLLAIGRRGSPRKLNIPGEQTEKVAYRLLEPENINDKRVVIVGGGDSAIEAALSLAEQNQVVLSYRRDKFSRLKPKNRQKILSAIDNELLDVRFNTNLTKIEKQKVTLKSTEGENQNSFENDLVYIFAGGELPTQFLQKAGVKITKRFGYTMKKY